VPNLLALSPCYSEYPHQDDPLQCRWYFAEADVEFLVGRGSEEGEKDHEGSSMVDEFYKWSFYFAAKA